MKHFVKKQQIKTLFITSVSLLFLSLGFSSCKKNNDDNQMGASTVIAINASSSLSTGQDFYVNNVKMNASALAYSQNTGYLSVQDANNVQFRSAGTSNVSASSAVNFSTGRKYSVYLTDDASIVYQENDQTAPASGKARVRFINLSQALSSKADVSLNAGAKIVSDLAYKAASAYNEVNAATTFSLYTAGSSSVLLNVPVTIQAGKIYTIYFSGTTTATVNYQVVVEN